MTSVELGAISHVPNLRFQFEPGANCGSFRLPYMYPYCQDDSFDLVLQPKSDREDDERIIFAQPKIKYGV